MFGHMCLKNSHLCRDLLGVLTLVLPLVDQLLEFACLLLKSMLDRSKLFNELVTHLQRL